MRGWRPGVRSCAQPSPGLLGGEEAGERETELGEQAARGRWGCRREGPGEDGGRQETGLETLPWEGSAGRKTEANCVEKRSDKGRSERGDQAFAPRKKKAKEGERGRIQLIRGGERS